MPVDAFASYPHYHDHISPIWDALETKGIFYVSPITRRPGEIARNLREGPPVIVAGFPDLKRTRLRSHIFVEHGIGEHWNSTDPHYAGGQGRESVILFLCPNMKVAELNAARYPEAMTKVVGSPRLESLARFRASRTPQRNDRLRVVVSFHWDNRTWPATRSALTHCVPAFGTWKADNRVEVRGHAHPRILDQAHKYFARAGIEVIEDFADVVRWADVYACDNSSTIFEAAALGIPVVLLDAPWHPRGDGSWRFDRFADLGPHASPLKVTEVAIRANDTRVSYDEMVTEVFGTIEGSAQRAATAIESVTHDNSRSSGSHPSAADSTDPTQLVIFGSG